MLKSCKSLTATRMGEHGGFFRLTAAVQVLRAMLPEPAIPRLQSGRLLKLHKQTVNSGGSHTRLDNTQFQLPMCWLKGTE